MSNSRVFNIYIGSRVHARTGSWALALRTLLDQAEHIVENGYARVEADDGQIIIAIDLDLSVKPARVS